MRGHIGAMVTTVVCISMLATIGYTVLAESGGTTHEPASTESLSFTSTSTSDDLGDVVTDGRLLWQHLTSKNGDIPDPGAEQQTSALVFDIDSNGVDDIVVGSRGSSPSVTWFRPDDDGWTRYIIDNDVLPLEAGGAFYDITGNGHLDFVIGEDLGGNKVYWWENPYPDYDPEVPWTRRVIKNSGANKHHDQIIDDFTGNGKGDLVFWNQHASALFLAEIPDDPLNTEPWPVTQIFSYTGSEMEGLASADINGDGKPNIVGGGRWFEHNGGQNFTAHVIDDQLRYGASAAGELIENGRPEVVLSAADTVGPIRWYELVNGQWVAHDLLGFDINHGHSLDIVDIDGDGHMDIFVAEMRHHGGNEDAGMWIFYGDGQGNFTQSEIAVGIGNHESKVGDLNGDGRLDILGKPYDWDTPRLDVWFNIGEVGEVELPLDRWERHVIDDSRPWRSLFIHAADINGNGHEDIVTGGWWYENPGVPGTSWVRRTIGSPLNNMAAVYDFDGDGHLDILGTKGIGDEANAEFVWARNDGNGNFTVHDNIETAQGTFLQGVAIDRFQDDQLGVALSWHDLEAGVQMLTVPGDPVSQAWSWERISEVSQGEDLSIGDIDGDGSLDLLLGTKWLRNDGDSWSVHTLHDAEEPDRNFLADINGNGRLDAVVGYEGVSQEVKLAWYEQGDDATEPWTEHVIANIVGPMSLDVRDMNNNGSLDIVVGEHNRAEPNTARLFIYENGDGVGGDWIEHVVSVGDEHHMGAQVADMFSDGDLDIISIGWDHNQVLLYENRAVSTALNRHLRPIEPSIPPPDEGRVVVGLQALYPFEEGSGTTVHDKSGVGDPLDLHIPQPGAVAWGDGSLTLTSSTLIASAGPGTKLIDAFQESNAVTIEAWIAPASASQAGPARIITMSDGLHDRNMTIGHGDTRGSSAARYDARLRTTTTNASGQPSLMTDSGTASTQLTHLVYTRTAVGNARVFLDGVEVAGGTVRGDLSNWDHAYRLGLGNEFGADRPWLGTYHLVAFYNRALSTPEVVHNFEEGPDGESGEPPVEPDRVTWIAPSSGAVLSDLATLVVNAPEQTQRVEFAYEDGDTLTSIATVDTSDANGSWSVEWDTTSVEDGSYLLVATAFDSVTGGDALAESSRNVLVRNEEASRITAGILALYDFQEGTGGTVHDVSGVDSPLDLEIDDPSGVTWNDGSLRLPGSNRIASSGPASKLIDAYQTTNALTVEAWIAPESATQSGPARIATVSDGLHDRNLTLGHGSPTGAAGATYDMRLRTTSTNANGQPSVTGPANSVTAQLQHVMYTRAANGTARLYIDGVEVSSGTVSGDFSGWNASYRLALGNELGADRPWLGTYHLVAFYDRALTADEVQLNYEAGPDTEPGGVEPPPPPVEVTWIEPAAGATLTDSATLRVDAPEETQRVEFTYEDGDDLSLIGTAETAGDDDTWSVEWDTTTVEDGSYQIVATAFNTEGDGDVLAAATRSVTVKNEETSRVADGLLALYDFQEGNGSTVHDVSGVGNPLDLEIESEGNAFWSDGSLSLPGSNRIASPGPATKLIDAYQASNAMTIEAWITPQAATQSGPARIATVSSGLFDRNVTLGHGNSSGTAAARYDLRLRTTATDTNGQPSVSSPASSATTELQHVMYTRGADGTARLYIDGVEVASGTVSGDFSGWNTSYRLALGNELGADRPWLGTYHLVAFYDRALTEDEVQLNYEAGPDADASPRVAWSEPLTGARLSDTVTLRVNAPDESARVEFAYQDGDGLTLVGTAEEAGDDGSWSIEWDTTTVADGRHQLVATAFDAVTDGDVLAEASRSITVRNEEVSRIAEGLVALYDFAEGSGSTVHDVSNVETPLDLEIAGPDAVEWGASSLHITDPTVIESSGPATKLIDALQASNAVTIEAWIVPESAAQSGPARIATVSSGLHDRNLTLGQGHPSGFAAANYDVRVRTTSTNANGQPSVTSPANSATTQLQHVMYTRDAEGIARLYIDGVQVSTATISGDFSGWDAGYHLALANEIGDERPWIGTYHLVAFYDQALTAEEVQTNFEAGAGD